MSWRSLYEGFEERRQDEVFMKDLREDGLSKSL